MSITAIGAINILFGVVKSSILLSDPKKPNGNLYRLQRPINSVKEDLVINSIAMGRGAVQAGVLNLNVYVPNLKITVGQISDNSQPDFTRLGELSDLGNRALGNGEEVWNDDGTICFNVQQDNVLTDENNQHYVNLRIEFYSLNIN